MSEKWLRRQETRVEDWTLFFIATNYTLTRFWHPLGEDLNVFMSAALLLDVFSNNKFGRTIVVCHVNTGSPGFNISSQLKGRNGRKLNKGYNYRIDRSVVQWRPRPLRTKKKAQRCKQRAFIHLHSITLFISSIFMITPTPIIRDSFLSIYTYLWSAAAQSAADMMPCFRSMSATCHRPVTSRHISRPDPSVIFSIERCDF